jgi:transposase-like protein
MDVGKDTVDKWVRQLTQERDELTPTAPSITPDKIKLGSLRKRYVDLKRSKKFKKGYGDIKWSAQHLINYLYEELR